MRHLAPFATVYLLSAPRLQSVFRCSDFVMTPLTGDPTPAAHAATADLPGRRHRSVSKVPHNRRHRPRQRQRHVRKRTTRSSQRRRTGSSTTYHPCDWGKPRRRAHTLERAERSSSTCEMVYGLQGPITTSCNQAR